jgi:hypothetical protein
MPQASSTAVLPAAKSVTAKYQTLRGRLIPALNPCWRLWMREEGPMQLMCLAQLGLELWSVQTDGQHFYMCHDRKVRRVAPDCEEALRRELHAVRGGFVREARLRLGEAMASSAIFAGGQAATESNSAPREMRVRQALGTPARQPLGSGAGTAAALTPAAADCPAVSHADTAAESAGAPDVGMLPAAPAAAVQVSYRRRRQVVVTTAPGAACAA